MRKLVSGGILHDQIKEETPVYHLSEISTAFDFATLPVIVTVLLLSVLSLSFIFHLRLQSSRLRLREFNNLWSVRVLLVLFICYWAINEITRLPLFRRRYIFPSLTLSEQEDLCKLHVVFSLGFLEPGFLITLLFIINESLKADYGNYHQHHHHQHSSEIWSLLSVLLMSLPTLILQIISVFVTPYFFKEQYFTSSLVTEDDDGNKSMTCTFPLVSSIIFVAFAVVYSVSLVLCCWRVAALVINKKMRLRISLLGLTVIISLAIQSLLLGVASMWTTNSVNSSSSVWLGGVLFGMFLSLAMGASVAEIALVINPILEALLADGGDNCDWNPVVRYVVSTFGV